MYCQLITCILKQSHIKNWTMRVQNRVLQYRHPDSKFRSIPLSRWLFLASRVYFKSRISPTVCVKIPNPGLQKRRILHPDKPIGETRQWISFFRVLSMSRSQWGSGTTKKSTVNSLLTDTCLRRTPGVGLCRFSVNYTRLI